MKPLSVQIVGLALFPGICAAQSANEPITSEPSAVTEHSEGLHGYIGFEASHPPEGTEFSAGVGFYSAAWPLIDRPLADIQIGLASTWIMPDNSDNKSTPLAPEGTLARTWAERGPTWDSVFQTVEGGLGYWAGNHFRYGPPKFSMNATPQCYDYEVGSPGWSFFYSNEALPDNRLGIAQLSNRLLIPPDGLPFQGQPNGEFLGYAWMALPFTEPIALTAGEPPTGDQSWTCFLSAANFKGPIAYYIPETWSKVGKLFNYPFIYGRGLDARPGTMGGGAIEINTVPRFDAPDAKGTVYSKIPRLQFPVDDAGRTTLVQDVTFYSKIALHDAFKGWRNGGTACSGRFEERAPGSQRSRPRPQATSRLASRWRALSARSTPRCSRGTCGGWSGSRARPLGRASSPSTSGRMAKNVSLFPRLMFPPRPGCTRKSSDWRNAAQRTRHPRAAHGLNPAQSAARSRPRSQTARWSATRGTALSINPRSSSTGGATRKSNNCNCSSRRSMRPGRSTTTTWHRRAGELWSHWTPP